MAIQCRFRWPMVLAGFASAVIAGAVKAQSSSAPHRDAANASSAARWTVSSPDASLAWFDLLARLRLPGAGAFAFVVPRDDASVAPLARALAQSRDFEILHFVPLYYPTADRAALVAALRAASRTPAIASAPRAELVTAALTNALSPDARRDRFPELASALEHARAVPPSPAQLAAWQQRLDSVFTPALQPWLQAERLDGGRLIVSPAIGAEGRMFAGTSDRADNIIAVGTGAGDPDAEAPLLAFVRELCFPAVTRAAEHARGFNAADPRSARRASLAAVRCGGDLLDQLLPTRAAAYRAFWLRAAGAPTSASFDVAFPPDPVLQPSLAASLRRVAGLGH
ncbi:MAG: hypothetical protein IPP90_23335 [Gemmatimonadaceae bacterium]|nr:hypothetical protein [Gemmatimonadaceae bacterium]